MGFFDELIATSDTPVLVHADLHHDNVFSSVKDGWAAIDPKGISAEKAYETAALIRNPYKKIKEIQNLGQVLYKRIIILSEELKMDPKRIHKWCLAQTVLSGVWMQDNDEYTKFAIKVAHALDNINI